MFSKLPWKDHEGSKSEDGEDGEDGESLTSILRTPEQRSDLTLLIADCTESMRETLTNAFDPKQTGKPSDRSVELKGDDTNRSPDLDTAKADVKAADQQRKEEEKRRKELAAPKMQELKQAALAHFDEWRDSVLQRVGEVVNSRDTAKSQKKDANAEAQRSRKTEVSPEEPDEEVEHALRYLYPPVPTPLVELEEPHRALILHSLLLLLLSLEHYSSHSRILLLYVSNSLHLSHDFLIHDENKTAKALLEAAQKMDADEETKKKAQENSKSRKWKVGLAGVAGAAVIGITGGLAAPLLAAGIGTVMSGLGLGATAAAGYLGALAGSSVLVGSLFGAYGAGMTGKMMDQYAREVKDFAFLPIWEYSKPRKIENEYRRLRVAVGISGWLTDPDEVVQPWRILSPSIEGFALRYELESLLQLGHALVAMISSYAFSYATSEIIKHTVFGALSAGLWPLGLLKVGKIIDNPFSVAKARSEKAGEVLADAIINKAQGERPLTLVGYSLGARVIYTCLMKLAERKAFGLIESVVFIGAPMPSAAADWRKIRSVVAGRVVNVYSTNDFILGYLYRSSSIQYGIAGLQKVEGVKGVENVDVSDFIDGHTKYRFATGIILRKIGFEDIDNLEAKKDEEELKAMEEKEAEKKKKMKETPGETAEEEAEKLQKVVEARNKDSMMQRATQKLKIGQGNTFRKGGNQE